MKSSTRLAFLQPGWPVQPYSLQLAQYLALSGVEVDFFYDKTFSAIADVRNYLRIPNLRITQFASSKRRLQTRQECLLYLDELQKAFCASCKGSYTALLGIEKAGVALAALLGKKLHIPHIHWSLELYTADNPAWMDGTPCAEFWLEAERDAHKSAGAAIIQDKDRASALQNAMRHVGKYIYLPVTINAMNVQPQGGHALHDLLGIPHDRKLLVCYGHNRMPADWIRAISDVLPEHWIFVLHGLYMPNLEGLSDHPRLAISTAKLPEADIPALIASAHAGLAFYSPDDINQTLTAFSSEKLARYLCAGIPVITYGIRNIHKLFDEHPCGVSVNDPQHVAAAIHTIEEHATSFHEAAQQAGKKYTLERAGEEALRFFKELTQTDSVTVRNAFPKTEAAC